MKAPVLLLLTLFILQSCHKCEGIACMPPPISFTFVLVEKTTGENLFRNGTYERSQIEFTNQNGDILEFALRTDNETYVIVVGGLGVANGEVYITLKVSDQSICTLHAHAERVTES